jgi:hypothetical protein
MKIISRRIHAALLSGMFVLSCNAANSDSIDGPESASPMGRADAPQGIVFYCPGVDLTELSASLSQYFSSLGVASDTYAQKLDAAHSMLQFLRSDPVHGTDTLGLIHQLGIDLREELIQLPGDGNKSRTIVSVSKKEILLALLQSGRTTQFKGAACSAQAIQDQIGVRQNIVAWSESIELRWPNGGSARWNNKYWNRGNLRPNRALHKAINDVFVHPQLYAIGCYTATKLIVIQGVLDYYRRVKKDLATADLIEQRLMQDGDPLAYIEPGAAWYFEKESTPQDLGRSGKLVALSYGIAPNNFVPGDWAYFLNTDPVTYEKTGYEGSNAIYLGRGKFDDYYNDNNHHYTYRDKLLEVYQWRHKVFSRERDVAKIHPLSAAEIEELTHTPDHGGIELDYRLTPYAFGFAELPEVTRPKSKQ